MRFFITKKVLVGVILALCALIYVMFLSGCSHAAAGLRPPGTPPVHGGATVADILQRIALWSAWVGGISLTLCLVAIWFVPNKWTVGRIAICAVTLIASGQVIAWIGANIGLIAGCFIGLAVLGLGFLAWRHLGRVEKFLKRDLNGDGKIGITK